MGSQGDIGQFLAQQVVDAVQAAFSRQITSEQAVIRPSSPERDADYQCNAAMPIAKQLGVPPQEVATSIARNLGADSFAEKVSVEGPGFINITLSRPWLERHVSQLAADPRLGVESAPAPRNVVIDYSSPNVAKEMHVGHLRPTVIGDALVRILQFQGHAVTRRNHLGDWGTPFGMLLEHLADTGFRLEVEDAGGTPGGHAINDLNTFYQEARKKFDADENFAIRARKRVVALQAGDEDTLSLWKGLVGESEQHFAKVYELLGVLLTRDDSYGESFYNPFLEDVVTELEEKGLARPSDGAVCVFPPGFVNRDKEPLPLIVRKSDGGYGYATTDLAAVRYWTIERGYTDLVYVVGAPQKLHFRMVFAASKLAGWLGENAAATHVSFGSVLGEDGKVLSTRAGGSVKLVDLLTEAVDRADSVIADRSQIVEDAERHSTAHALGIGAVKYADLSNDRDKDYLFDWDRMLAMEGNTSVYLQYANARICSVLRKSGTDGDVTGSILLGEVSERELAIKLAQFPAAIAAAAATFHPHKLCTYLYETAQAFSAFYQNCPVLAAESEQFKASRLRLCWLTSRVLVTGLDLLGIGAPERL